ncbi:MAG TPA: hypothetical protein VMR89_03645 [Actinomycetota bacterium]|nr:hypothetical protein [Actinomycetota bacterium]
MLDFKRDAIRSTNDMTEVLDRMARLTSRQSERMGLHTRRMAREVQRGGDIERSHRLVGRAARDLDEHADDLDKLELRFRTSRESMIANTTAWLQRQPPGPDLDEYRELLRGLAEVSKESRKNTATYRDSVAQLRRQNVAQSVNRATDRLAEVLTRIIEDIEATERFYRAQGRKPRPRGGGS